MKPEFGFGALVDLKIQPGFDERFKKEVRVGIPFIIYTHEAHADVAAVVVAGNHLLGLSKEIGQNNLKGFVMPVARSVVEGQQSMALQLWFKPFNLLFSLNHLKTYLYTRKKDELEYGMSREHNISELRPLAKEVQRGYAPAVFAGGSVEAGRHDPGADLEQVHGLQRLEGIELLSFIRLVKSTNGSRKLFLVIIGLHGGFRLLSPNKGEQYPTKKGLATFFGVPESMMPHVKMEANLGSIITEDYMVERFGKDWIKASKDRVNVRNRVQSINDFIMEEAALLVPPHARGVYSYVKDQELAIELSCTP